MRARTLSPSSLALLVVTAALAAGCVTTAGRFPTEVQASIAHSSMRRLETDRLVIFHPANRRDEVVRLADRLERCADALYAAARIDNRHAREKMFIVVPDTQFNNAYVGALVAGLQDTSVVPAVNSYDFATGFGLPPDPASIGCHELVHYVQQKQIGGLWGGVRRVFGDVISPQLGLDAWFWEGLATYYEARLQPGLGRPRWPVFTGMFGAAYAGGNLGQSDLSESKRAAVFGNHYLVGSMFISFLAERYGDAALWRLIELQARSASVFGLVDSRFAAVYGKGLGELIGEFKAWTAERFPVRPRPAGEQVVRPLGTDARWAWAGSGAVAVIDSDLDRDTTLTVWEADGGVRARRKLVDLTPPRSLTVADPSFVSGMSFTADGRDLYFTAIDRGDTYQTTRLFRVRGDQLTEITSGLGPGGTISADGQHYFHLIPDGDRWSLGAYDLASHGHATLWTAEPGQYALTVQASADGRQLAISGWNGRRFVIWVHDAATGARLAEVTGTGDRPLYDPSFGPGGKLVYLDAVDGRFQVALGTFDGRRRVITDTAYGALAPRVVGDRLRYLSREGLRWTLVESAIPGAHPEATPGSPPPVAAGPVPQGTDSAAPSFVKTGVHVEAAPAPPRPARVLHEGDYSMTEGLFDVEERGVDFAITPGQTPADCSIGQSCAGANHYSVGLTIGGRDRLDMLRWQLGGIVDVGNGDLSGAAVIEVGKLAPWNLAAYATVDNWREGLAGGGDLEHRDRAAALALSRIWRDSYGLLLSGVYRTSDDGTVKRRLWGPEAELDYVAADGSAKAGIDRGVIYTLSGGYYPKVELAGATDDVIHGRTSLDLYGPLPFGRRHVLHVRGRAAAVFGHSEPLLDVGGLDALALLWSSPDFEPGDDPDEVGIVDPTGNPFNERLRGFEDLLLPAYRTALADADWRYPLIIDRGLTHLAFMPATFVRELDLEAFGSAAWIDYDDLELHAAIGAMATFRIDLFRVPLALRYQLSRRLTDDDGVLHLLTLAID